MGNKKWNLAHTKYFFWYWYYPFQMRKIKDIGYDLILKSILKERKQLLLPFLVLLQQKS